MLSKFLILTVAIVFCLSILEICVRIFWASPGFDWPQTLHQKHSILGWEMIPNQNSFTYDIAVTINSFGLRDDEFVIQKSKKTRRILILGDSVTFGVLVGNNETYPNRIESMLNAEQNDIKYEVINAGVQRYYTYQELDYLKLRGLKFDPDIVILGYYINDLGVRPKSWQRDYENEREKVMTRLWQKIPALMKVFKNSALVSLVRDRYFRLSYAIKGKRSTETKLLSGIHDKQIDMWISTAHQYIAEIDKMAKAHGFKFLVVAFPGANQVLNNYPNAIYPNFVEEITKQLKLPYVNLIPAFKEHFDGDIRSLYFRFNGHPNKKGHQIAAIKIREKLSMLEWLKVNEF